MRISSSLFALMLGLSLTGSAMAGDLFKDLNNAAAKVQKETNKVQTTKDNVQASADDVKAIANGEDTAAAKKEKKKKHD